MKVTSLIAKNNFSIVILVTLINAWIWKILSNNLLIGIALVILSIQIYLLSEQNIRKSTVVPTLIFSIIITFFSLNYGLDQKLKHDTPEEIFQINQRRSYYPLSVGRIFENRPTLTIYKFNRNLSYNLDPNLYFFATHPRERSGIAEFKKYSFLLFPFFIIGIISLIIKKNTFLITYLTSATIISALITPSFKFGPLLFFPFLNSVITIGILATLKNFWPNKTKKHES